MLLLCVLNWLVCTMFCLSLKAKNRNLMPVMMILAEFWWVETQNLCWLSAPRHKKLCWLSAPRHKNCADYQPQDTTVLTPGYNLNLFILSCLYSNCICGNNCFSVMHGYCFRDAFFPLGYCCYEDWFTWTGLLLWRLVYLASWPLTYKLSCLSKS